MKQLLKNVLLNMDKIFKRHLLMKQQIVAQTVLAEATVLVLETVPAEEIVPVLGTVLAEATKERQQATLGLALLGQDVVTSTSSTWHLQFRLDVFQFSF
jgi:P2-related tail formation protein